MVLSPTRHVTRCLVAGIVALLPIGGAVMTVAWLESSIADSWRQETWYFPGLGILVAVVGLYLAGLFVTTFLGRWLWRMADRLLGSLPLLGSLYQSLKEVLGYNTERGRFFQGVVAVPSDGGFEIGFVTGDCVGPGGRPHKLVFVPSAPNPTSGKLVLAEPAQLHALDVRTADALRALVSLGKSALHS